MILNAESPIQRHFKYYFTICHGFLSYQILVLSRRQSWVAVKSHPLSCMAMLGKPCVEGGAVSYALMWNFWLHQPQLMHRVKSELDMAGGKEGMGGPHWWMQASSGNPTDDPNAKLNTSGGCASVAAITRRNSEYFPFTETHISESPSAVVWLPDLQACSPELITGFIPWWFSSRSQKLV